MLRTALRLPKKSLLHTRSYLPLRQNTKIQSMGALSRPRAIAAPAAPRTFRPNPILRIGHPSMGFFPHFRCLRPPPPFFYYDTLTSHHHHATLTSMGRTPTPRRRGSPPSARERGIRACPAIRPIRPRAAQTSNTSGNGDGDGAEESRE